MKEQLTLEQLAGYLPYKLKLYHSDNDIRDLIYLDFASTSRIGVYSKPIFRNLQTDLTKEIEHGGRSFIPMVELSKIAYPNSLKDEWYESPINNGIESGNHFITEFYFNGNGFNLIQNGGEKTLQNQYELFQHLQKWHFWIYDQSYFEKGIILDFNNVAK